MRQKIPGLTVPARLSAVPEVRRWAAGLLAEWRVSPNVLSDLLVALSEVCTNIIRHGYQGRPGKIRLSASRRAGTIRLTIEDDAPPFVPEGAEVPSPRALAEGGYGLSLIHGLTDEIGHETLGQRGNRTTLVKHDRPRRSRRRGEGNVSPPAEHVVARSPRRG